MNYLFLFYVFCYHEIVNLVAEIRFKILKLTFIIMFRIPRLGINISPPVGVRSIAISVSVCFSVCLCVCLYTRVSLKPHIQIPSYLLYVTCGRGSVLLGR